MIDAQTWVAEALARLKDAFGPHLVYLGLQGSYGRGEATETSDIDLVALLDKVDLDDLDTYRSIVHALPEGRKACGFISGRTEFFHWPRHELFPFAMDTVDHYGRLEDFLPPITKEEVREGARISASALVHLLTHGYLYADADAEARPAILKDAYKSAFFLLRVTHYLATGVYLRSKKELLAAVEGVEKDILVAGLDFPARPVVRSEKQAFGLLLNWCRGLLIRV